MGLKTSILVAICCCNEMEIRDVTENKKVLAKNKISMFLGIILLTQKYFFKKFADTSLFF